MNTLRFEVSAPAPARLITVRALQDPAAPTLNNCSDRPPAARGHYKKPWTATVGSVTVRVYKTKWYSQTYRRTYAKHIVAWTDPAGANRKESHADQATARRRATEIATSISNGQATLQTVTPSDWATYRRALELLAPTGKSLELAASDYAAAIATLGDAPPSLQELAQFWRAQHPSRHSSATCPQILEEMLRLRRQDGVSQNTLDDYKQRLGRFCRDFTGAVTGVTGKALDDWLAALNVSRRTRNNYRGNLNDLFTFARRRQYVPKEWDPIAEVPVLENEPVKIEVFKPADFAAIIAARQKIEIDYLREHSRPLLTAIPYLAIAAWAGCRHEEICPGKGTNGKPLPGLDWEQIDFEQAEIHILPEVARKTGRDRIIPMQPNLVAWLEGYAQTSGPVCALRNITNPIVAAAEIAGVQWLDNGPRKSFISYRLAQTNGDINLAASEAGNSPAKILKYYKKTRPKREADRWFNIWPTSANVIQLNLAFR